MGRKSYKTEGGGGGGEREETLAHKPQICQPHFNLHEKQHLIGHLPKEITVAS